MILKLVIMMINVVMNSGLIVPGPCVDHSDRTHPGFDFSCYLTPGAGPTAACVHTVLTNCALLMGEMQVG